ncbi:MAG: DUF1287 domain-containing protein [Gammaproteobacteria bacterium]|nr:DUF1287 domain-containing protein [Gammaproteobacteria bacterium]
MKLVLTVLAVPGFLLWTGTPASANEQLAAAALQRTEVAVTYDPAYIAIPYPNGDVPDHTGVCTDLVIRSFRAIGIDLQRLVHEDMSANFGVYPDDWGHDRPDTNIDHRRVPNLETFFERHGESLSPSRDVNRYKAGDIVTWRLPGGLPHIGIVSNVVAAGSSRPLIVHNIGRGPKLEDMLFEYELHGHYRYEGQQPLSNGATQQGD